MRRPFVFILATLCSAPLAVLPAAAHARARLAHPNPAGGTTARHVDAGIGPHGTTFAHGRRSVSDGTGQISSTRAGVFRGAEGASAAHASRLTREADGALTRDSRFAARSARGSLDSQGSVSRAADGTLYGDRSTTAQGSAGGSYAGSTHYDQDSVSHSSAATRDDGTRYTGTTAYSRGEGVSHSGGCSDPSGKPVACR